MAQRLQTKLDGVALIGPVVHGDERSFVVETYAHDDWAQLSIEVGFVQHNHSRSSKATQRGIHFQTAPGQAKLVRGAIVDVAVDLRDSPTYGRREAHVGLDWQVADPPLSERDKKAPRLAEVTGSLPFTEE